jgi:hypothetical protein
VRPQYSGEFLGVAGLMGDDVAHRPGFTPGTGIGPALLHRIDKGLPFGESVIVDLSSHATGVPADADK